MEVVLIDKNNKTEQRISISSINDVSGFLTEIYKQMKLLDNDSYYCIFFNYINKYNKKVHAKLGYIYKNLNCREEIITKSDDNYLKYYINQLQLTQLEIEYKMYKGNISNVQVFYDIEITRYIDDYLLPKKINLLPEKIISYDYRFKDISSYNFYKLKKIKYTNLKNIECTLDLKEKNMNIPVSEMIKVYEFDISKEIRFFWIVDRNE